MGKIKSLKNIEDKEIFNEKYQGDSSEDVMAEDQVKETPSKIKIKAYDECIELIEKFIREKSKTRNIFYVSDLNEIINSIQDLENKEDEK